jgi:4-diphosphocytidyl-2-C-methyl-D-erythritol kinase
MSESRLTKLPDGRFQIAAHAKLNLGLRVFPARPDGFHNLETWMVPTSWYDTLWVEVNGEPLKLEVTGRAEGVPTDIGKNLVGRAAVALAARAGIEPQGKITLHKVLPPGGGIGGGSADAACALVALNEAWGLGLPMEELERIAATLGSDIPFFVRSRPTLCTGRGEIMTPLPAMQPLFAVLVIPPQGCPTKDVYQAFDRGHQHLPVRERTDWPRCARATAEELSEMLVNDLEPPAFAVAPWLADLRQRTAAGIGRKVHMTGSGSTLFTLCSSGTEAEELQERMEKAAGCPCVAVNILR